MSMAPSGAHNPTTTRTNPSPRDLTELKYNWLIYYLTETYYFTDVTSPTIAYDDNYKY